jgi:hypothetical protein
MKNLVFLVALVLFLVSCTNVKFVSPQPEFLKALSEIPEKYHGSFMDLKDKDTCVVTKDAIDGMSINADSVVVKARGNYLYINILDNNKGTYQVYVFQSIRYLNYEKIYAIFPNITEEKSHLFNVISTTTYSTTDHSYLLDNVTVNQFNLLVNSVSVDNKMEWKRLK